MKRNIKSKLLTVLLAVVMFIGVIPNTVHAAGAAAVLRIGSENYGVVIDNDKIICYDANNNSVDMKTLYKIELSYVTDDDSNRTLNVALNGYSGSGMSIDNTGFSGGINIILNDKTNNTITNNSGYGIEVTKANLSISGTGSLTINSSGAGIFVDTGKLIINDGSLNMKINACCIYIIKGGVDILGGNVILESTNGYAVHCQANNNTTPETLTIGENVTKVDITGFYSRAVWANVKTGKIAGTAYKSNGSKEKINSESEYTVSDVGSYKHIVFPAEAEVEVQGISPTSVSINNTENSMEYTIIGKGKTPDWSTKIVGDPDNLITFKDLNPATEYDIYARTKDSQEVGNKVVSCVTLLNGLSLTGEYFEDEKLTVTPDPADTEGLSYQWYYWTKTGKDSYKRAEEGITGATSNSYELTESDIDKYIGVVITKGGKEVGDTYGGPVYQAELKDVSFEEDDSFIIVNADSWQGKKIENKESKFLVINTSEGSVIIPSGKEVIVKTNKNAFNGRLDSTTILADVCDTTAYSPTKVSRLSLVINDDETEIEDDYKNALKDAGTKLGYSQFKYFEAHIEFFEDYDFVKYLSLKSDATIRLTIPDELKAPSGYTRSYKILHYVDGTVTEETSKVEGNYIVFTVDSLSPFAIAYKDTKNSTPSYVAPKTGIE